MEFNHISFTYSVPAPQNREEELVTLVATLQTENARLETQTNQLLKSRDKLLAKMKELAPAPPLTLVADNRAMRKQIQEMAGNIVDLVSENTTLLKRNKTLEERNAQDAIRINSLLSTLSKLSLSTK